MDSRIPSTPKSLEAEQAFLGSLIMDSSSWDQVSHMVESKDFIDTKNREIFNQIYNLVSSGQVIDVIVLGDALKTSGLLDKVGGLIYLGELAKKVPTSAHIKAYADIIKENSIKRELINISTRTIQNVHQSDQGNIKDILDKAESEIFGITADSTIDNGLAKIGPVVNKYIENVYNNIGVNFVIDVGKFNII